MVRIHAARRHMRAGMLASALCVVPLAAQPSAHTADVCTLIPRTALQRLSLPPNVSGVPDSGGVMCRWGNVDAGHALVIKTYPTMTPATIERMRMAAARTSDPILEPSVADGAWSVGKPFGFVLMAGRHGKALQLQYYVPPHSKGADRVDHRATNADRQALLVVAKAAVARL
jgi:hypothetical protein